ncbi:response regulator [Larkinella humicola]|uniref:Response regulator transcription factor n=1 Tax=Larkinella humicola TaxID=2607654 RepID=A0A5N1JUE7_9BACT|nr:response regulator [Larkinella humicola]KAA9357403.1 response regulator transcription factor [Larkinella humicola]
MPTSLKILIVEDETITAMDLSETLEEAGHKVTAIARDSQQALAAVKRNPPDLALIDIVLEGSTADGIATAKELLVHHQMPILYLTANSDPQTFQEAKATLPAAYVLKPYRANELVLQVELAYHFFQSTLTDPTDSSRSLFLPVKNGHEKIALDDVLYLIADRAYTNVYLIGKDIPYCISTNLSHLSQYFPASNFYRVSQSILINLHHLKRVEQNHLYMTTHTMPIQIPVANRKKLMQKLKVVKTK